MPIDQKPESDLPPEAFSSLVNQLKIEGLLSEDFCTSRWQQSPEWRFFVAGNNYAITKIRSRAAQLRNVIPPKKKS